MHWCTFPHDWMTNRKKNLNILAAWAPLSLVYEEETQTRNKLRREKTETLLENSYL